MSKVINVLFYILTMVGPASAAFSFSFTDKAIEDKPAQQEFAPDPSEDVQLIWNKVMQYSSAQLIAGLQSEADITQKAWLELALISKSFSLNKPSLLQELSRWRINNPEHPANNLLPEKIDLNDTKNTLPPHHFALLLPQEGVHRDLAKAILQGFLNEYYQFSDKSNSVKIYDTASDKIDALYQQAVKDGADFIIGPLTKQAVQDIIPLTHPVPVLALNYTENTSVKASEQLYQFGLSPEDEILQMIHHALQAGFSNAILITARDAWSQRLATYFRKNWKIEGKLIDTLTVSEPHKFNFEIAKLLHIDPRQDKKLMRKDNRKEVLRKQRRQDFDVIFLFASQQEAKIIIPLLRFYYADDIAVYTTSNVLSTQKSVEKNRDLAGVTVCDIPKKTNSKKMQNRFYALGRDTYLLSQNIARLKLLPTFPLYANTGALWLGKDQQIHRRLPCRALEKDDLQ